MLSNCGAGEDSWESFGQQGDQTPQSERKSTLNIHWKDYWWSFNTLAIWCEQPTYWKRPWCWERLRAGGEGGDRGCDDWMASPTQWTCVWASSGRWEGQRSLVHCSPWGGKESGTTQWLNNKLYYKKVKFPLSFKHLLVQLLASSRLVAIQSPFPWEDYSALGCRLVCVLPQHPHLPPWEDSLPNDRSIKCDPF